MYYVETDCGLHRSHTLGTDVYSAITILSSYVVGADRFFRLFYVKPAILFFFLVNPL